MHQCIPNIHGPTRTLIEMRATCDAADDPSELPYGATRGELRRNDHPVRENEI